MKVSDILRVKGSTLFTVSSDTPLTEAVKTMAEQDVGSLVVMDHGDLTGMLTFREVIAAVVRNQNQVGTLLVRSVMDDHPMTCTMETEMDEVRRMMLGRHARYMPVLDGRTLMGVISFYDVAKAVVDAQDFENRMLKAYIRDWPSEDRRHRRHRASIALGLQCGRCAAACHNRGLPESPLTHVRQHVWQPVSRHQFR